MKRLLLILALTNTAFGDLRSIGHNGINSATTGLNGSSPISEAIVIGQAEDFRSGKPDYDTDPIFYAPNTVPFAVWFGNVGSAPSQNLFVREHPTEVAGVMVGRNSGIPGVAPAARLHSLAFTDEFDNSNIAVNLQSLARVTGMRAINISYGVENNFLETNGRSLLTQFVDWSAERHDVLYVAAFGNSDNPFDASPADQYNGITVGASAPDSNGVYDDFSYINRDPRDNQHDRSYIDILAPGRM